MEEKPSQALRRGRNTSMWRAIESVEKKEAEVAVSAGNTGALMAMSMFQLAHARRHSTVPRSPRCGRPSAGRRVVLDVGANVVSDAQQLVDFAVMGEAFARAILGLERPTVGILNVGAEDVKGNDAVRGAAQILRSAKLPIEFCGFVEGDDIAEGTVDVVVTDGFTGNIALKTAEGTAKLVVHFLRTALRAFVPGRDRRACSPAARSMRCARKLDPRASNGGIFLGLNGVVVKSHGGTDALGFASALDMAIDMAEGRYHSEDRRRSCRIAPLQAASAEPRLRDNYPFADCRSVARICPKPSSPMPNSPSASTPATNGSSNAPASAHGTSRRDGEKTSRSGAQGGRARRWPMPGSTADELDLIIVATTTPDETFPVRGDAHPGASRHDARRRVRRAGGLLGLCLCIAVADNFIKAGQAQTVLVVGAETMSRLMDWTDRTTCVLFGDGAGAVVLQRRRGRGQVVRSRRAQHEDLFRRTPARSSLRRWGSVVDPDDRPFAHAGQRSLPACRDQHHAPRSKPPPRRRRCGW